MALCPLLTAELGDVSKCKSDGNHALTCMHAKLQVESFVCSMRDVMIILRSGFSKAQPNVMVLGPLRKKKGKGAQ